VIRVPPRGVVYVAGVNEADEAATQTQGALRAAERFYPVRERWLRTEDILDKPIIILSTEQRTNRKGDACYLWDIEIGGEVAQVCGPGDTGLRHRVWLYHHPGQKAKLVIGADTNERGFKVYRIYKWNEEDERAYQAQRAL
jgi:hypothetical protein